MTDKGAEPAAAAPAARPAGTAPVAPAGDRRTADPGLTAPPPPPASPPAARPADLVAETAGAANETAFPPLRRVFERIARSETAVARHIDERLAELPAAIERRLAAPPRRDAPPEAVPNLLERIAAQGAENETNLAKFVETRAGRIESTVKNLVAADRDAADPGAAAPRDDDAPPVARAGSAAPQAAGPPGAPAASAGGRDAVADAAAGLEKQIRAHAADFQRWQSVNRTRGRRLAAAAVALGAPCLLALGLFLQAQFAILPAPDPANGWRDLVWSRYGPEIAACVLRARAAGKPSVCEIVVP